MTDLTPEAQSILDDYYGYDDARDGVGYSLGDRLRKVQAEARQQGCPDPADHALADAMRPWLAFLRAERPCPECGHDEGDHVSYCAADGEAHCPCLFAIAVALEDKP